MTESSTGPKKSGKGKKLGRNKANCASYRLGNSAAFRKARWIAKHLRNNNGNDKPSVSALTLICEADTKSAKAFLPLSVPSTPGYIRTMRYGIKRAAKAQRQLAKAQQDLSFAEHAKDSKAASIAHTAILKAHRYYNRYHYDLT